MHLIASRIDLLGTENAFRLGADIARCEARGRDVIKLNLGEPDFDSPPHVNEVAIEHIRAGNSHYSDPAGLLSLREAVAAHVERTRGFAVDPDRIVITTGAKPVIGYTMMTYVEPGHEVIYPSPGFPIYESWTTFCGARPVPLHLREDRGFSFGAEDLERLITERTKVIILNSPSNPTGGVLSQEDLEEIAQVIRERCSPDVRILSDEIYEHIVFDGLEHRSIAALPGMEERTILASGHSKGFAMTGWRLGWCILPAVEEAAVFKQLNINTVSCVPPFVQEAGRAALEDPRSAEHVRTMVETFQRRRDLVVDALRKIPGVTCRRPKGAFYVFPGVEGLCARLGLLDRATPEASPTRLLQMHLLEDHGVAVMDRESFGRIGAAGQHFLRLSIAASTADLEEGVRRIAAAAGA